MKKRYQGFFAQGTGKRVGLTEIGDHEWIKFGTEDHKFSFGPGMYQTSIRPHEISSRQLESNKAEDIHLRIFCM